MICFYPLLHRIKVKEKNTKKPPEKIGEYYIVRGFHIHYIGKSINLRRRMSEHRHSGKLRTGDTFYYRIALPGCSQEALARHERKMIARYHPSANRSKGGEGRVSNRTKYWFMSGGPIRLLCELGGAAVLFWYLSQNANTLLGFLRNLIPFFAQ